MTTTSSTHAATSPYEALDAWINTHFDEEVRFLQELVRVPTDTPPGNNAPHAERAAELLKEFGFDAEKHAVPAPTVAKFFRRDILVLSPVTPSRAVSSAAARPSRR